MDKNIFGERTDCAFYKQTASGRRFCQALYDWYNAGDNEGHCDDCPFFKTEGQLAAQEEKCEKRLKKINYRPVMLAC